MAFGLGVLRLSPRQFWAMSLPELEAASHGFYGGFPASSPAPMSRSELASLMARFPDGEPKNA